MTDLRRACIAEFLGTALLLLTVVGSGIMGDSLAAGNVAVALLANSLATAAVLYVILTVFGPVSGAHLNPLVSAMAWADGAVAPRQFVSYALAQFAGAVAGVWTAHLLFGQAMLQVSSQSRAGARFLLSELLATLVLLGLLRVAKGRPDIRLSACVALVVGAGYWTTSSTFFANPAATFARALTATFAGVAPHDAFFFVLAQAAGLGMVLLVTRKGGASASGS